MSEDWGNRSPPYIDNDDSMDTEDEKEKEMEFYLYSLVHHDNHLNDNLIENDSLTEVNSSGSLLPTSVVLSESSNPDSNKKVWQRYFDPKEVQNRNWYSQDTNSSKPELRKNPFWKKPYSQTASSKFSAVFPQQCSNFTKSERKSGRKIQPFPRGGNQLNESVSVVHLPKDNNQSANPSSCTGTACSKDNNTESENTTSTSEIMSSKDIRSKSPGSPQGDDRFESPLRATPLPRAKSKSEQNLDDCMTQVLGSMLDEDASRSSVDSERRSGQDARLKARECTRSTGPGWTVGMSWDDMSSKFKFNFEEDSVCSESIREGSISAGSRVNSPELVVLSPALDEVSKYDTSLKNRKDDDNQSVIQASGESSDSEVESIIEVSPPDKAPPLLVEIESDGEDVVFINKRKLGENDPIIKKCKKSLIEEDIVVVYETGLSNNGTRQNAQASPRGTGAALNGVASLDKDSSKRANKRKSTDILGSGSNDACSNRRDFDVDQILAGMSDEPSLWRLSIEDMIPSPKRPFFPPCSNCKQRDHHSRQCPEPPKIKVCYICASPGHGHSYCPERTCLICKKQTTTFIMHVCLKCARKRDLYCSICQLEGHDYKFCPDIWRRYHSTTVVGPPVAADDNDSRPAKEMYCCNCARKGHYSHHCQYSYSGLNENINSTVVSYSEPAKLNTTCPTPNKQKSTKKVDLKIYGSAESEAIPPIPDPSISSASSPAATEPTGVNKDEVKKGESSGEVFKEATAIQNHPRFLALVPKLLRRFKSKLRSLPKRREALISFLQRDLRKLRRFNRRNLDNSKISQYYKTLMALINANCERKGSLGKVVHKMCVQLSQLNAKLVGCYGLANGEFHVAKLKEGLENLRRSTHAVVSPDQKQSILPHYRVIFQGNISDLPELVQKFESGNWKTSSNPRHA